ncbi:hypothetical protein KI387_040979 [Taxus chinensis]|uniref:Uncharacterized protein n=1 Tax=Taxus chinensis TaxID=29808 RepID=A0AA38CAS1_TAXCH|nr:hypothetical protein KI387_040979 [Taxus chinensis]
MHKGHGKNIPTLEERSPILWAKQGENTELVGEGTKSPSLLGEERHAYFPKARKEMEIHEHTTQDLHLGGKGAMKNEDSTLTSIIVPESQHVEVIVDHCLINTANISACVDSKIGKEDGEQVGKEKGMIGNHFSKRHDNNQLVGLFRTTINKEPKDKGWVHEPREEGEIMKHKLEGINPLIFHDDSMISNEGMLQEEKEEKSDLQDGEERLKGEAQLSKDDRRYEHDSDLLLPTMLFQIYGHEKIVERDDLGANVMLRSTSRQIGSLHDDTGDGTSDLHRVHGPRLLSDLVGCHVDEEVAFSDDYNHFQIAGIFRTAVTKKQRGDGLDLGKSYEDISNTHEQGMKVVHPCKQLPSHACIKTKVTLGSGTEIGLIRDNLLSKASSMHIKVTTSSFHLVYNPSYMLVFEGRNRGHNDICIDGTSTSLLWSRRWKETPHKGQNEVAGLFLIAVKRRSFDGNHSPNKKPKVTQDKHQQLGNKCKKEKTPSGKEIIPRESADLNSEIGPCII